MPDKTDTKYVTYITVSVDYERYGMNVPNSVIAKGKEAIRKYIWEHDSKQRDYIEHVERADRRLVNDNDDIEDDIVIKE